MSKALIGVAALALLAALCLSPSSSGLPPWPVYHFLLSLNQLLTTLTKATMPPEMWLMMQATGYLMPKALYVACRFQFADHLTDGPLSVAELAARAGTDPATTERFLKYLAYKGVFRRESDHVYANTHVSEHLRADDPHSVRAIIMHFDFLARGSTGYAEAAKDEKVYPYTLAFHTDLPYWDYLSSQEEEHALFDLGMVNASVQEFPALLADYDWAQFGTATIVDVGGGIGHFTAALLQAFPFKGVVYDYSIATGSKFWKENYKNIEARNTFVQGSFLESVWGGGDVYILKHILHDWPDSDSVTILSKVAAAMQETKRRDPSKQPKALIIEGLYDFPPPHPSTAELDMMMLVFRGRERSVAEFTSLSHAAGLKVAGVVHMRSRHAVVELELI